MHDSMLEPNYTRIDIHYGFYLEIMYFITNYMRLDLLYEFYSVIMQLTIHASCKNYFISNTCTLACSPFYLLTESCTHYVFFHCFQARGFWFIIGKDFGSTFRCLCRVIFIEYVTMFMQYNSYKYMYIFGACEIQLYYGDIKWIDRAHELYIWMLSLGMMMIVVNNRLKGMYIHYELCILRFYKTCLGIVGFSMLGLCIGHGQKIWIVT